MVTSDRNKAPPRWGSSVLVYQQCNRFTCEKNLEIAGAEMSGQSAIANGNQAAGLTRMHSG